MSSPGAASLVAPRATDQAAARKPLRDSLRRQGSDRTEGSLRREPTLGYPSLMSADRESIREAGLDSITGSGQGDVQIGESWPWFSENGILETLQVVLLLVMLARYVYVAKLHTTVLRPMFAGASVVILGCILREVEFDPDGSLAWADRALRGPGRIIAFLIAIPVGFFCIRALLREPQALPRLVLGSWWGRVAIIGGLLVVLAALYDRSVIVDQPSHSWEEIFETLGYLLAAWSTFMPVRTAEAAISRPLWSPRDAPGTTRTSADDTNPDS